MELKWWLKVTLYNFGHGYVEHNQSYSSPYTNDIVGH